MFFIEEKLIYVRTKVNFRYFNYYSIIQIQKSKISQVLEQKLDIENKNPIQD